MFNDNSSPLSLLQTRRSGKPRDLVAPGPDEAQLRAIVEIATRTPDHGKLAPWRFVLVPTDKRDRLADIIETAYRAQKPDAGKLERDSMRQFAHQAPALVVALFSPVQSATVPLWEQQLSVGAAIMNLLHATHAMGFAGGWLTGWPSYNDYVRDAFGTAPEQIAGFIFIGTPSKPLSERPRPEPDDVISVWRG